MLSKCLLMLFCFVLFLYAAEISPLPCTVSLQPTPSHTLSTLIPHPSLTHHVSLSRSLSPPTHSL